MFKLTPIAVAIAMLPMSAFAGDTSSVQATITDYYKNVVEYEPYWKNECTTVDVPIYGTVQRQGGASGGDVLGGMIIGGILGKGLTGKDNGAAAGAVMGGIIAADKANRPKTEQVITGYRKERQCQNVEYTREKVKRIYDYSKITWIHNGKQFSTEYVK